MRLPQGKMVEGGSELQTRCPKCGREKMFIHLRKRIGYCQRCHHTLTPQDLQGLVKPTDHQTLDLSGFPVLEPAWDVPDARAYLRHRGLEKEDPNIFFEPITRKLYFRIWSPSGDFSPSYHTRDIRDDGGWVCLPGTKKEHYLWGPELQSPKTRIGIWKTCIVEGIFDSISVPGSYSILGTRLSNTARAYLTSTYDLIWLWLDPDSAGEEAADHIVRDLLRSGVEVIRITHDKEPSDCTHEERQAVLRQYGYIA